MLKNNIQIMARQSHALSGTPRIVRRQAETLARQGHHVDLISDTFHGELKNYTNISWKKTYKWPKDSLFRRTFYDWQAQRISRKLPAPKIVIGHGDTLHQDILFVHTCVHLGAEISNSTKASKNTAIAFHDQMFREGTFKMVVCNSKMMRDDFSKRFGIKVPMPILYPGFHADLKNRVIPAEVNKLRDFTKAFDKKLVVGVVTSGNLENRGAFALIKAVGKLSKDLQSKIEVLIVGKEGHPEKIHKLAQENEIANLVHWMEPREDVANIIACTDIIVHAAKIEAFGMSVIESMSFGKPIITTKTTGCSELLTEEQRDFIIDSQTPDQIAQKLAPMIESADLRKRLGELNITSSKEHTWDHYDSKFLKLVQEFDSK